MLRYSVAPERFEDMPPVFVWHGGEDTSVPPENSLLLAIA